MEAFFNKHILALLVISEILFAVNIGLGIWVGLLKKRIKKLQAQNNQDTLSIEKLSTQLQNHQKVSNKTKQHIESGTLVNEQRIKNLERFRKLYFELNDRLTQEAGNAKEADEQVAELNRLLDQQTIMIDKLKQSLEEYSEKYVLEHDMRVSLETTIKEMEGNTDQLHEELQITNKKLTSATMLEKELEHYRGRVDELEQTERQYLRESQKYQNELDDIHARMENPTPFGVVKLTEIEQLSSKLSKKEKEITSLRNECDTIAKQYEDLAASSLKKLEDMKRANMEEQINVQQMQFILEQSARALEEKSQEVKRLEEKILQGGLEASAETRELYNQQLAEQSELEVTFFDTADKVSQQLDGKPSEQMKELKQSLEEKRSNLRDERRELIDLHEDGNLFTDGGQENSSNSSEILKKENQRLQQKVARLQKKEEELVRKNKEITRLNKELEELEQKYLELVDAS